MMPGMSGSELAERFRVLRPGIKTLFMSGYTEDLMVRHDVRDEALTFIGKPFTPAALIHRIQEILGSLAEPSHGPVEGS
jgi:two-component system cell cycle sensor histidine kinase/response regulator CckA